ncbi:MAG: O-methyltransferase [Phycisphaerae bacterium]|jgi:SAM-dependent methyltransferase|nr:MAG: O-methyltransferase [Phycisphaerae bacterium]
MDWTPDRLTSIATGYWQSAALIGAVELSVFDHLDVPRTTEELARRCGAQPDLLPALLDALVGMRLLQKHQDLYQIAPGAQALLSRHSPTCMTEALRYNADLYRQWGKLSEVIRSGHPAVPQARQLGQDDSMTRRFVYGMESKAKAFTPVIAPMIKLSPIGLLLDVGSGPGTLSRALLERYSQLRVTLVDLPEVLNIAREICSRSSVMNRISFHPANYRTDPLPRPVDSVVYAGALHQETRPSARRLFRKLFECLRPGGSIHIVDMMLEEDRTAPLFSALFQITMLLIQPSARVFSQTEVIQMLRETGFQSVHLSEPESSPYRLVSAYKPEE